MNFLCARDLLVRNKLPYWTLHMEIDVCVCLLITVVFADNTVCVVSFRAECVWHRVHPLPQRLWPLTVLQVVLLTLCWRPLSWVRPEPHSACPGWEDGWSPFLGRSSVRVWPGTIRGICLYDCFTVWFYMLWISLCVSLSLCENTVHMFVRRSDKDEENPFECKGQSNQMCIWVFRAFVIKGMK